eukprot:1693226-Alexandrium_andersonii.AAC.1
MSASLVGSEMCIRDRLPAQLRRATPPSRRAAPRDNCAQVRASVARARHRAATPVCTHELAPSSHHAPDPLARTTPRSPAANQAPAAGVRMAHVAVWPERAQRFVV